MAIISTTKSVIDEKTQSELRQRFNPDGSILRRQQLRMLEILEYVDRICEENGLNYWLSSGTCLGAVRHGGFIPWDDDVDIEMPGDDYERLISIIETDKDCPYILHNHSTDSSYVLQFSKLRDKYSELYEDKGFDRDFKYKGIYIDIFCLDLSNSRRIALFGKYLTLACLAPTLIKNKKAGNLMRKILYFINFRCLAPIFRKISKTNAKGQLRHRFGGVFLKPRNVADIYPLRKIDFEDKKFNIPNNVDNYLMRIYGDYMKIPDIDKIQIHSSNVKIFDDGGC